MRVKQEECDTCGGTGLAQLGVMPSVILNPEEDGRWVFAEACIHCGATRATQKNFSLVSERIKAYAEFLEDNEIVEEGELDHLL